MPALPPIAADVDDDPNHDAPQTQEWLLSQSQDNAKRSRIHLSYINKGILATKSLFLSSDNESNAENEDDVYLIGKILSAPRKGCSDTFKIEWDQS
jgi:hypothetical protein